MLESKLLEHSSAYVGGEWIAADSGRTFAVHNPATGELLADVPRMGSAETTRAVEAAAMAMADVAPLETRRSWLNRMGDLILEHQQELGRVITLEHGKPLPEGKAEAAYAAQFFHFFAGQLEHLQPQKLPNKIRDCDWEVHHRPAGVVAAITPWNFPFAMMAKKIPAALGCGCGVVCKPASATPLSGLAMAKIAELAELPAGMLNMVPGSAGPISNVLCTHPAVRTVSFTGSTEVGEQLGVATAPHIKRLALELGGNAPFLVFEDANLKAAAKALIANKFRGAGQTCVCTNRVYVQASIVDEFADLVATQVSRLTVSDGMAEGTDIGPLINRAGFDKVAEHVLDALQQGATRIVGDDPQRPQSDIKCFYPPTVLKGVKPNMLVCREETFGPLVAIATFDDEPDAIAKANDTEDGLAAYLFTADGKRADRVAARLSFGHVGINTGQSPTPEAPFGGMKKSGYGREGGVEGLMEFCEYQTVVRGT